MSLTEIARHIDIGNALFNEGKYDEALKHYRKALTFDRHNPVAYYNIANILAQQGKFIVAEKHYQKAIDYGLKTPEVFNNIGNVLKDLGKLSEATSSYRIALSINPQMYEALNGLGNVLLAQGFLDDAIRYYREALNVRPFSAAAFSNLLLTMNYHHKLSPLDIFNTHKSYGEIFDSPISNNLTIKKSKKIKIGYVSADFRRHSVSYFLLPIFQCHDKKKFEVYCYSDVLIPDEYTKFFKNLSDVWIDTYTMHDNQLYERIVYDDIDILIDLAGHSAYNRLPVFAKKPSPIQITYLGYPNTTGLTSMDYRIVDSYTDPEGLTDGFNTEKLIRLKDCFLCFCPDENKPECLDPPIIKNGYVTFGSLNNLSKVNDFTIDLWSDVLLQIRDSRIIIKSKALSDDAVKTRLKNRFIKNGIEEDRVLLMGYVKGFYNHLEIYNLFDISLDTFPYNGTTTTFESILMGTPVVTLVGNTHCSRVGFSILKNLQCDELIATKYDDFLTICKTISSDISMLNNYKQGLRERLLRSILTDKSKFVSNFEKTLINIYNRHI